MSWEEFWGSFGPLISAAKLKKLFTDEDCADHQTLLTLTRSELDVILTPKGGGITVGLKKRIYEGLVQLRKEEALKLRKDETLKLRKEGTVE